MLRVGKSARLALLAGLAVLLAAGVAAGQRRRAPPPPPLPETGTLVLDGEFPGAAVFLDAEEVGTLPLAPRELGPGPHTLRVTLPGHTEYTEVVQIQRGQETRVTVTLMPVSMVLHVVSTPAAAQVFVDGQFRGATPLDVDLLEGTRSLRLTLPGYHESVRSIEAVAGRAETLELTLEPLPEEQLAALRPAEAWYQKPVTWIVIGGAALVVAAGVVLAVVLTAEDPDPVDEFCGQAGGCIRIAPGS